MNRNRNRYREGNQRTPAQIAYSQACRRNNHGEASFETRWNQYCPKAPFPFERQVEFRPNRRWSFDFYDEETRTAIEIDGDIHSEIDVNGQKIVNRNKQAADREKRNAAIEEGIAVLVYTPDYVEYQPERVIKQILLVLERRRREECK